MKYTQMPSREEAQPIQSFKTFLLFLSVDRDRLAENSEPKCQIIVLKQFSAYAFRGRSSQQLAKDISRIQAILLPLHRTRHKECIADVKESRIGSNARLMCTQNAFKVNPAICWRQTLAYKRVFDNCQGWPDCLVPILRTLFKRGEDVRRRWSERTHTKPRKALCARVEHIGIDLL